MNELVDATNHDRLSLQGENLSSEKFINTGVTSFARRARAAIMVGSSLELFLIIRWSIRIIQ